MGDEKELKCDVNETRLNYMEGEINELKENVKKNTEDISMLKENQAETRIYIKQILENISDIKVSLKSKEESLKSKEDSVAKETVKVAEKSTEAWSKIVLELIKTIGVIAGIIAGIKLLG